MAPKPQKTISKKRKTNSTDGGGKSNPKKLKSSTTPTTIAAVHHKGPKKAPFKSSLKQDGKGKPQQKQPIEAKEHTSKDEMQNKREGRKKAKELAEARKKRRKKHYDLEKELAFLWEKMRRRNIAKEQRSKLVTDALQMMNGKIVEIACSHASARILQTCVKYCSPEERNSVYLELKPHLIRLAGNTYAVHLVTKLLDTASKDQMAEFISFLHGHVASLLRHMVGSLVIEHAYILGNATQKQALLMELYSPELQLFKDLVSIKENKLVDVISKLQLQKSSVVRHMNSVLQPIIEKGILDHSITHRALMEYLNIADKTSASEVIQQLSGPLLVRMVHTKDGSKIGMLCINHGSAKERKKIIKGLKDIVARTARDKYGSLVLAGIMSVVDDTKLVSKIIVNELKADEELVNSKKVKKDILMELIFDQFGRRPILQLLHPYCHRYFGPEDLTSFSLSLPSLTTKEVSEVDKGGDEDMKGTDEARDEDEVKQEVSEVDKCGDEDMKGTEEAGDEEGTEEAGDEEGTEEAGDEDEDEDVNVYVGGKKDPLTRRKELLIDSGLAEKLINKCCERAGDLLKSKFGKEVLYEVATGGVDGILCPTFDEKLNLLHEVIAEVVSEPKLEGSEEEHLLEEFHSSRTLRKLILECPAFATILWEKTLKGKCAAWAKGHSSKVISAFMETKDSTVRKLVKKELQPLIDSGVLQLPVAGNKVDNE